MGSVAERIIFRSTEAIRFEGIVGAVDPVAGTVGTSVGGTVGTSVGGTVGTPGAFIIP